MQQYFKNLRSRTVFNNDSTIGAYAHRRNLRGVPRGTGTPHFFDWGVQYPTFQEEKVKNLLSPEAIRGD